MELNCQLRQELSSVFSASDSIPQACVDPALHGAVRLKE